MPRAALPRCHCKLPTHLWLAAVDGAFFPPPPVFHQPCFFGRAGNASFFPRPWSRGNTQHQIAQLGQAIFDVFRLIAISLAGDQQFAAFVNAPAVTV